MQNRRTPVDKTIAFSAMKNTAEKKLKKNGFFSSFSLPKSL
jgi:hypothetical protein